MRVLTVLLLAAALAIANAGRAAAMRVVDIPGSDTAPGEAAPPPEGTHDEDEDDQENPSFGYRAATPAIAYARRGRQLVVWAGHDRARREFEIFGRVLPHGRVRQLSAMGGRGTPGLAARSPQVAYDSRRHQYLVVWSGVASARTGSEIYARRVSEHGRPIGRRAVRISTTLPDPAEARVAAQYPSVAYAARRDEYMIVWHAEQHVAPHVFGETEIYGQRLSGTGRLVGPHNFQISRPARPDVQNYVAISAHLAYDGARDEYMVVWDDNTGLGRRSSDEREEAIQRVAGDGRLIGANRRITNMGPDGTSHYCAYVPVIGFDPHRRDYLVTWYGDTNRGRLVSDEYEIFGQRLSVTGREIGHNDFRISHAGRDGNPSQDASVPSLAYDPPRHGWLVLWQETHVHGLRFGQWEVFGRRLDGGGRSLERHDVRLTHTPHRGRPSGAFEPAAAWQPRARRFEVVWRVGERGGQQVRGRTLRP